MLATKTRPSRKIADRIDKAGDRGQGRRRARMWARTAKFRSWIVSAGQLVPAQLWGEAPLAGDLGRG